MHQVWTHDLETGVAKIDEQHREIFRILGNFRQACDDGRGGEAIAEVVSYLQRYVQQHFALEEMYMVTQRYPEYDQHREAHDELRRELQSLVDAIAREGPRPSVVIRASFFFTGWLRMHIGEMDKAMGKYLTEHGAVASGE